METVFFQSLLLQAGWFFRSNRCAVWRHDKSQMQTPLPFFQRERTYSSEICWTTCVCCWQGLVSIKEVFECVYCHSLLSLPLTFSLCKTGTNSLSSSFTSRDKLFDFGDLEEALYRCIGSRSIKSRNRRLQDKSSCWYVGFSQQLSRPKAMSKF